ncbi:MAG: glycoside hydrolase family 2 protein [Sphaerochaetaceae bacterium]|nr:hypothetical protein [Spirochaetales bacterium]MDY5499051.1 glycoside hydrolase family 2 protein [Sphaerochaetaceae bacterium]
MRTIELESSWKLAPTHEQEIHQYTHLFTRKTGIPVVFPLTAKQALAACGEAKESDAWPDEASWNLQATFHISEELGKNHLLIALPQRKDDIAVTLGDAKPIKVAKGSKPLFLDVTSLVSIGRNILTISGKGLRLDVEPRLLGTDSFLVTQSWVSLQQRGKGWKVVWHATVDCFTDGRQSWKLSVGDQSSSGFWHLAEGETEVEASLSVRDPEPYTLETPVLSTLVMVAGETCEQRQVGFSSYAMEGSMPVVNGKKTQLWGALWKGHGSDDTGMLVHSAKAAHMRLLRATCFESEEFYRVCDQEGLLVLQDLSDDPELDWQVRRIASHPSLFGWYLPDLPEDGSKEALLTLDRMAQDIAKTVGACDGRHPLVFRYLDDSIEEACGKEMGNEASSPSSVLGFGWGSYPCQSALRLATGEEHPNLTGSTVEALEEHPGEIGRVYGALASMFAMPDDRQQVVYLSQCLQALVLKQAVDGWRVQDKPMGMILVDKLAEERHEVGRALIGQDSKWKLAMYAARDLFFQPVRPIARMEADGSVSLFAVNDGTHPLKSATFTTTLLPYDGITRPILKKYVVSIPTGGVEKVGTRTAEELAPYRSTHFLSLSLVWKDGTAEDGILLAKPKACRLLPTQVASSFSRVAKGIEIILSSRHPALMVGLDQGKLKGSFSKNWFPLFDKTSVIFEAAENYTLQQVKEQLSVYHLAEEE